jgi:RHS repeat-associated protein
MVGYGWQLSIPYIQRLNKTGSQNLYGSTPYFTSSLDGELVNGATTTSASTTLPDNNIAYWKFDESSGNASSAVGGNTFTNNNSVAFSAGKINNAASFSGNNFFNIDDASQTGLDFSSDFSVSAWVNFSVLLSNGDNFQLINKWNDTVSAPKWSYMFNVKNNSGTYQLVFATYRGTSGSFTLGDYSEVVKNFPSLTTNTWYHIVVTKSGTTVTFYINGSLLDSGTLAFSNIADSNADVRTGRGWGGSTSANAKVDEVGMWNRALTASEVTQLYNSGSGLQYPFSTTTITEGSGQTELWQTQPYGAGSAWWAGATKPAPAAGSQSMSFTYNAATGACDEAMVALRAAGTATVYAYPQTGYMNPDAVGSIGNGVATTTYTYDANGNVVQSSGWTYVWDYLNRMLASGYNNSTTSYAYDATGARVLQTSTTSTIYYPSKYFSLASTTSGGTSWATSTNYIWLGDTLLATVDQKLYNSAATGTAIARYVHPDHLGSTNVVTDASGTISQLLDYYPYGATRVSSTTYPTNEKRQYIGQFSDLQTNLSYLNARFYEANRGQFLSEDPTFLAIGDNNKIRQLTQRDQSRFLSDPQQLNSYSYARGNPITNKDPEGLFVPEAVVGGIIGGIVGLGIQGATDLVTWNLSSPQTYAGAMAGGATFGGIVGATDGLSLIPLLAAGGASGAVQSGTTQGLNMLNGSQTGFNYSDFGNSIGLSALTAPIPGLKIAGVTAGRGSFQAVERQVYTKFSKGALAPQNVSLQTYGKMTGAYTAQQTPGAAVQGILNNLQGILNQISSLLSSMTPSNSSKQK